MILVQACGIWVSGRELASHTRGIFSERIVMKYFFLLLAIKNSFAGWSPDGPLTVKDFLRKYKMTVVKTLKCADVDNMQHVTHELRLVKDEKYIWWMKSVSGYVQETYSFKNCNGCNCW